MSIAKSILQKIRMALAIPTPSSFPAAEGAESPAQPLTEDLALGFAERFSAAHGKFVFCLDEKELAQNLDTLCRQKQWAKVFCSERSLQRFVPPDALHNTVATCEAAIIGCEALAAKTGSLILSAALQTQAPVLVCIAHASQLVFDVNQWLTKTEDGHKNFLPPLVTLVTGPSRAGNGNPTNVYGLKEVYCFVVENGY